jgi:hypothetical protein
MVKVRARTVEEFTRKLDPERRKVAVELRALINKAAPQAEETVAWGYPWWKLNGWLCTVYTAGDHINFGFSRGAELDDPDGMLEGTGKGMRHIKVFDVSEIKKAKFTRLLKQAAELNRASGKNAR